MVKILNKNVRREIPLQFFESKYLLLNSKTGNKLLGAVEHFSSQSLNLGYSLR